jgi:gamma-glutamyltranspeptidase / glutathione hydrolase
MNIQAALEAPRFSKQSFAGCDVPVENRFSQNVRNELATKGHKIDLKGTFSSTMGGGQAVLRDAATGVNYGGSDPRKDGEAIAELPE